MKISLRNNSDLEFIANFLKPFTQRAYLVGGSVRDLLLGLEIHDFDIEIYDISPLEFEKIMQKLPAQGFGKSFFVYKFKNFDLALARKESKISHGHKGFEVVPCQDEKMAAKRRDFTLNSMMINIFTYEFLDFYGGLDDLKNGILRHIDECSFKEDSLRILRAVAFAARFDFKIAQESLELMQTMDISDLSKDRINAELYKFFAAKNLRLGYEYLQILHLDKKIFGFHFESEEFKNLLESTRLQIKSEHLFLYLYLNFFSLDKKEFFARLKLKKNLLLSAMQPYFLDMISDFEMMQVSLLMPLKDWLGTWNDLRIEQAKKLKIYDKKFKPEIDLSLLKDLNSKDIGMKVKEMQNEQIQKYLAKVKQ